MEKILLGAVTINFPDETISYFYISQDFVSVLNAETNFNALKDIRSILRNRLEARVYKRLDFDSESDSVVITTSKGELILKVAILINQLANIEISNQEVEKAKSLINTYKRPKKQKWKEGTVFTVPMKNNSFVLAQVLEKINSFTAFCAFYNNSYTELPNVHDELSRLKPSLLITIFTDNLDNHVYKVIDHFSPIAVVPDNETTEVIRLSYFYSSILIEFAEAMNGIRQFEPHHEEILEMQQEH